MSEKSQALRLINNLLADIREPDFIWQVVALLACIGSALLIARWWRSRHEEGSGRLNDASARLAFPLTGMVLTGIALTTLDNFLPTCSSWPCRCSARWPWCAASSSCCARLFRRRRG
jgi:hypothetical protein